MKTKAILLISLGVLLATIKVCHKNRDRLNGLPMSGSEEEDKTKSMSSSEIKEYVQGTWKDRNDDNPDVQIAIQGQTLILTQGESRKNLTMSEVGYGQIVCRVPEFYHIIFSHSKHSITIGYFTKENGQTNTIIDYYDRIAN
jgi:hypothetical protein